MSSIETLVKAAAWEQVVETLESQWQNEQPNAKDSFFRALAAFALNDYFNAYQYGVYSFEQSAGDSAEVTDFLSVLCVLVGKLKESYFYRKNLSILEPDPAVQDVIPFGVIPNYTNSLEDAIEKPLLEKARSYSSRMEWDLAEHWFAQYQAFEPQDKIGYIELAKCQMRQERYRAASETLKSGRVLFPQDPEFAAMLGYLMTELGQFSEARASYQWGMDNAPHDDKLYANYILDMQVNPNVSLGELLEDMTRWGEEHVSEMSGAMQPRTFGERQALNVGLIVSGVDRTRVAPMLGEIFSWKDESKLYVIGYGEGDITYPFNSYFKTATDEWRDISATDSMTLRNMVIADGVDVLIDLGGLSSIESLKCFGSRLAPLQISWSQSVLPAVLPQFDYLVASSAPAQLADKSISSKISNVICARRDKVEDTTQRADNTPTFIADVTLSELNFDTISLWSKVLLANPEAMLVLRSHDFHAEDNSRVLIERFGLFGIPHRVDVIQESDRRVFFQNGDVALLPVKGAKADTVLDAFSVGIPVLGLREETSASADGKQLLEDIGFAETMVFDDSASFVENASRWMQAYDQRSELPTHIEEKLEASGYLNAQKRMAELTQMIEDLWQKSCK